MENTQWNDILASEVSKEYFKKLMFFIKDEYKNKTIYPAYENIFNALKYTDYNQVKVVILGQDPYHEPNEAHGLAFSVLNTVRRPPSLAAIFKELEADVGIKRNDNNLTDWALNGVLLLNAILTVEKGHPLAHKNKGWEVFTDNIIRKLNERDKPVIFVLWGNYARSKKKLITNDRHYIIESVHPSPLSSHRGFFGSKPFSKINDILKKEGISEINW